MNFKLFSKFLINKRLEFFMSNSIPLKCVKNVARAFIFSRVPPTKFCSCLSVYIFFFLYPLWSRFVLLRIYITEPCVMMNIFPLVSLSRFSKSPKWFLISSLPVSVPLAAVFWSEKLAFKEKEGCPNYLVVSCPEAGEKGS